MDIEYFDFFYYRLVGIFDYDSPKLYLRIINFFTKIANWIIVILTLGTMAADIVVNIKDLEAVTNDVGYLLPMLGILIKTFAVTRGQKNIRRLIEDIHKPIKKLCYCSGEHNKITYNSNCT